MTEHTCMFEEDPDAGVILEDAVCAICGRTLLSGYALPIDIEPASSTCSGEEQQP